MSNAWDWKQVDDREYWMDPSDESYFYAEKWKREGRRRVLDLGCGLGRHSLLFSGYGFDVTAIDSSEEAVEHLMGMSDGKGLGIRCDVGDMHDLPYADGSFDCVFAYLSVSHTDSEGIERIMSGIRRILVPGGALFFTLCSKDTWSFTDAGYPRRDANTVVKTEGAEAGIPHFFVNREDIEGLLAGFRLLRVRHVDDCFFQGKWRASKHYFIEAEKLQRLTEQTLCAGLDGKNWMAPPGVAAEGMPSSEAFSEVGHVVTAQDLFQDHGELPAHLLGHLLHLLMGGGDVGHAGSHVRQAADACDGHAHVLGRYGLDGRAHSDGVRAHDPEHVGLGGGLVLGSRVLHIHTFGHLDVVVFGRFLDGLGQLLVVDVLHPEEPVTQLGYVLTHQGRFHQAYLVGYQHERPGLVLVSEGAGGVGEDKRVGSELVHDPDGKDDVLDVVPLVIVDPALHDDHFRSAQLTEDEIARMPGYGGCGEPVDLAVRDDGLDLYMIHNDRQAAAENDGHIGHHVRELPDLIGTVDDALVLVHIVILLRVMGLGEIHATT